MKRFALVLVALSSLTAQAGDNLVCALKKVSNPSDYVSVKVEFDNLSAGGNYSSNGSVEVGENAYSFDLFDVIRDGDRLRFNAIFFENNNVQDEVAHRNWTIDLAKAPAGKPIVLERVIQENGKSVANFICYLNRK